MDRPACVWKPTLNFSPREVGRLISCVIIHATVTEGSESPLEWLCSSESKVSAHYLIDVDGTIYQLVQERDVAWHAGVSEWDGQANVNDFSIGIELVNLNDGVMPFPNAQIDSLVALCVPICLDNKILTKNVVGHVDIAPLRKTDPKEFPWDFFRAKLITAGVPA